MNDTENRLVNGNEPEPDLLLAPELLKKVRLSLPTVYRLAGQGKFPRPIKIGLSRVAWLRSEIEAWIADRISERDAEAA